MPFKIGIPTLLEHPDIDSAVSFCRGMKLNLIEIGMTRPAFFPSSIHPDALNELSQQYGIEFTAHLPEEFDIATFHASIRDSFVSWIIQCLDWAKQAHITMATMHLSNGIYYTLPDGKKWLYDVFRKEYIANISDSFHRIHDAAQRNGVTVCIENCANFHRPFIREAIEVISPFSLTWDVGHDAFSGYLETSIIRAQADKIAHMHLHDHANKSPHKEIYTGDVDIDRMVHFAREKDIRVIIEVKTAEALENSLRKLREKYNF